MNAGTVKVGRWHYPALQDGETVTRNTKRDGSGEWSDTNPALFRPVGEGDPAAEKVAIARVNERRAEDIGASKARHPAGKATKTPSKPALSVVPPIEGFTDEPVEAPKVSGNGAGHGGKVGAQTKKPGKSNWEVGGKCPQGHLLTDDDGDNPVYVMPSGRKQCRKCRRGYGSNS